MHTKNTLTKLYLESRIITQSVRGLLQLNPSRGGPPQHKAPESLAKKKHKKNQHKIKKDNDVISVS